MLYGFTGSQSPLTYAETRLLNLAPGTKPCLPRALVSHLSDPLQPGMFDHTTTGEESQLSDDKIGEIDEWSGMQGKRGGMR